MPDASRIKFNEVDNTFGVTTPTVGRMAVIGNFKRGPINDPSDIILAWPQFVKKFGGYLGGSNYDASIAQRMLARGGSLRVVNIRHYEDITDPSSLTAVLASPAATAVVTPGTLITGVTLNIVINGTTFTQLFTTDIPTTLNAIVALIKAGAAAAGVQQVYWDALNGAINKIYIIATTGDGDTMTVTSTATGTSHPTPTVVFQTVIAATFGGDVLFQLNPKYAGQDYNNLVVKIYPASNGDVNSFNVSITHLLEPSLNENYTNLKIIGNPTVANSTFLQQIVNGSKLVSPVYLDLSGFSGQIVPVFNTLKMDDGSDGGDITDIDNIGNSASKTGLFALDAYDDISDIFYATNEESGVHIAGAAYAANRQDLVYFGHIPNDLTDPNDMTAFKDGMGIDTSYSAFYGGGVYIPDPFSNVKTGVSELGDVLGAAAFSDANFGPWYSFAGKKRGLLFNILGIVNNFGLDSLYSSRNLLANHQINVVGQKKNVNQIFGNFTGQVEQSTLSYLNVRRFIIYLKKLLGPIFDNYIEEPCEPATWKACYNEVLPVLKKLKSGRALSDFSYQGDQDVTDVSKCVINDPTDIDQGKYLVKLFIKDIVSLQIFTIEINLTDSSVSFEDNLSSLNTNSL